MTSKYAGRVNAPEFPAGGEWLNVKGAPSVKDFAGRLLVLDFWSYCCINCMHVIPVLRRLERKYPEEMAVVGVHSPKFVEERAVENVRHAVMRYGVTHPVFNDSAMQLWQAYAVRAWPTLMFIDPTGKVIGKFEGEPTFEEAVRLIDEMLEEFRQAGTLRPKRMEVSQETLPRSILSYPGKVLLDLPRERLFIADSGHHRVLVTDLEGVVQTVIGSGNEGLADGVLEGAQLRRPQGMAAAGEALYIADTENHAIRLADLEAGTVETIAGTGRKGVGRVEGGHGLEVDLRSPWDLALVGRRLYVAMAGSHQIWEFDLDTHVVQAVVGTGGENILDGPPHEALLAQPSGIAADEDGVLYFADSETSSIRLVDLFTEHRVRTLVGRGLFEFGDEDGTGPEARLQHPLGVDVLGSTVYVADTYNDKIRVLDIDTLRLRTLAGTGRPGHDDGPMEEASFHEPGGLAVGGGRIYVADTNNHAVRVIDLESRMVRTLEVDF